LALKETVTANLGQVRSPYGCKAIIETPKGRRNKFDYDPKADLFGLARISHQ
jgi:hypothetical protein